MVFPKKPVELLRNLKNGPRICDRLAKTSSKMVLLSIFGIRKAKIHTTQWTCRQGYQALLSFV